MNNTVDLPGKHPVIEALRAGRKCRKIVFYEGIEKNPRTREIEELAKNLGIQIQLRDKEHFEEKFPHINHQSVYAVVEKRPTLEIEDLIAEAGKLNPNPFLVIMDKILYPQNMGAVIRTAECAGAHGIIIPKRRTAEIGMSVSKISAGAVEHMMLAETSNIVRAMKTLKKNGYWIGGATMEGATLYTEVDYSGPFALVVGNEEKGIGPAVLKECDFRISIPLLGRIDSLNASVAAGILIYEVARQRGFQKAHGQNSED